MSGTGTEALICANNFLLENIFNWKVTLVFTVDDANVLHIFSYNLDFTHSCTEIDRIIAQTETYCVHEKNASDEKIIFMRI